MLGLRDYQESGADAIYSRDRSLVLAKMGAGKTAMALTAMRDMKKDGIVKRWLVVAPKRVCADVWPQETALWTPSLSLNVALGNPNERMFAIDSSSDIVVINYENLQWLAEAYPNLRLVFDGVVFDELTRLKNPSGKRFKAFLSVIDGINVRVGLTGSFTSNGLEDVFGQVNIIDKTRLGRSKGAFLQEHFWCADPAFGDWIPRPGALGRIMDKIRPITFLLESKEYEDSLPPLRHIDVRCSMDMRQYNKMKRDFVLTLGNNEQVVAANAGVVTGKLQQLACGWVYKTDVVASHEAGKFITTSTPHWFSHHKFDTLNEILEENHHEPTLVWYWYKEELGELKRRYPYAQTLDDKDAVNRWNAGQIKLLLAHPASAGHGLNLQGQCAMVFLSLPWSLELLEQAIARLHRSGQRHEVRCYRITTAGTIDEKIWAALHDKRTLAEIAVEALR